jgi:hypothetical protein
MPTTEISEKGLETLIMRYRTDWNRLALAAERASCGCSVCGVYSVDAGLNLPILAA